MRIETLLTLTLLLAGGASAQAPKNVILLIGDGMGTAHVTAAANLRGAGFRMGSMPVTGLMTTRATDSAVTDSAAAATALATGVRTVYRRVGADPEGAPLPTLLEAAQAGGKATGVVTTGYFWDATPAAFAAHVKDRHDDAPAIVRQMLASRLDLIGGGGLEMLGTKGLPTLDEVKSSPFAILSAAGDLEGDKAPRSLMLLPTERLNLDSPDVPLPKLAEWALRKLSADPDGFVLVVEHEGIDSTSHQNNGPDLRAALTSFDAAVGVALDFASARGDTLVVVTGDHETGGLRISETRDLRRWRIEFSTTDHTAGAVAVFASGPGAGSFAGLLESVEVGRRLLATQAK